MLLFTILYWGMKRYGYKVVSTDSVVTPFWTVVLTEMHREFLSPDCCGWLPYLEIVTVSVYVLCACVACKTVCYAVRVEQCSGAVHSH